MDLVTNVDKLRQDDLFEDFNRLASRINALEVVFQSFKSQPVISSKTPTPITGGRGPKGDKGDKGDKGSPGADTPPAGVSSLNVLTGDLTIAGTHGLTVTPAGSTITISGVTLETDLAALAASLGSAAFLNVPAVGNATSGQVVKGSDTRLTDSRNPTGAAGGDLSGTYPNPVVAKIQTIPVLSGTPTDYQLLQYSGTNSRWQATSRNRDVEVVRTFPIAANYSWVNQGAATLNSTIYSEYINAPADNTENYKVRMESTSLNGSGNWTATVALVPNTLGVNFPMFGLVLRNSTSGNMVILNVYMSTGGATTIEVRKMANGTTNSGQLFAGPALGMSFGHPVWLQIQDNGTNRIYRVGRDGGNWIQLFSELRTVYITPTNAGFGCASLNATYAAGVGLVSFAIT